MAKLTSRGYSQADADAFMARCLESHTVEWRADSYQGKPGGGVEQLATGIPIIGGQLTIDSSDPVRRRLTLDIGGADAWASIDPDNPLMPYGAFIKLWLRIDRAGGGWFPWVQMGEMPIRSFSYEKPSMVVTVECTDWSGPVDDFLHVKETSYVGKTLAQAVKQMVNAAVPYKTLNDAHISDAAKSKQITAFVAKAGSSRWDKAQALCNRKGQECFFNAAGDLIIRKDRIDPDDDGDVVGVGPDVGSRSKPVAVITDGPKGNMIAITVTVSRDGAINGVFFPLVKPRQKQDKDKPGTEGKFYTAKALQTTGPLAWNNEFGFMPAVFPRTVKKLDAETKQDFEDQAASRLRKRRGVLKQIDADVAALWWIEADDLIRITVDGAAEDHFVSSVTFDLAGGSPTRIKTRQLNVKTV